MVSDVNNREDLLQNQSVVWSSNSTLVSNVTEKKDTNTRNLTELFFHLVKKSMGIVPHDTEKQSLINTNTKYSTDGRLIVKQTKVEEDETETGERDEELSSLDFIDNESLSWSESTISLRDNLKRKRIKKTDMNRQFLMSYFKNMKLVDMKLTMIDKEAKGFTNLTELSVSVNYLKCIRNLPSNLQILNAYGNQIEEFSKCKFPSSLLHLGLGYNQIVTLNGFQQKLPQLVSLDLSFNKIVELEETLKILSLSCPSLKQLSLMGNPLYLDKNYKPMIVKMLPQLLVLDDVKLTEEDRMLSTNESDNSGNSILVCLDALKLKDSKEAEVTVPPQQLPPIMRCFYVKIEFLNTSKESDLLLNWTTPWSLDFKERFPVNIQANISSLLSDVKCTLHEVRFSKPLNIPENKLRPRTSGEEKNTEGGNKLVRVSSSRKSRKSATPLKDVKKNWLQFRISEELKAYSAVEKNVESVQEVGSVSVDASELLLSPELETECTVVLNKNFTSRIAFSKNSKDKEKEKEEVEVNENPQLKIKFVLNRTKKR